MSESTPFMFTQAIQPSDSTKFVRGVAELAREKQRKALMDLERAKQNAAQIANATAGYNIDAIPEAWRGPWNEYLAEEKSKIIENYSSDDQEEFQKALDGLNNLTNLYTTLSTATPDSVTNNIQTLKKLQDDSFRSTYDRNLGVFEEVDDANLGQQVAEAEMGIQNPFGKDYEFKIADGQPVWEGPDGDVKDMNDYMTTLSAKADQFGPKVNMVSPIGLDGASEMIIDEMEGRKMPWSEEEARNRVDRKMEGPARTHPKKMFRYAIMNEIGFDNIDPEDIQKIMDGKWEDIDKDTKELVEEHLATITTDSEYGSSTTTTTTTTEASSGDEGPGI